MNLVLGILIPVCLLLLCFRLAILMNIHLNVYLFKKFYFKPVYKDEIFFLDSILSNMSKNIIFEAKNEKDVKDNITEQLQESLQYSTSAYLSNFNNIINIFNIIFNINTFILILSIFALIILKDTEKYTFILYWQLIAEIGINIYCQYQKKYDIIPLLYLIVNCIFILIIINNLITL